LHASLDNNTEGFARLDIGGGEGHVVRRELDFFTLFAFLHRTILGHILWFSRQKHFVNTEIVRRDAADVGRNYISCGELNNVTNNKFF